MGGWRRGHLRLGNGGALARISNPVLGGGAAAYVTNVTNVVPGVTPDNWVYVYDDPDD